MNQLVCERADDFARQASNWCQTNVRQHAARALFVPAGQTPIPLYELWEKERPTYLEGLDLLQVDDVLQGEKRGLFKSFFQDQLPSFSDQVRFIESADRVADLALLGLGLNGHIAFHEPGLPASFFSGCVPLGESTRSTLQLESETWGVTYGAAAFLQCKAILMMVRGASKAPVLARFLAGDPSLPVSTLRNHGNLTVLADVDALKEVATSIK